MNDKDNLFCQKVQSFVDFLDYKSIRNFGYRDIDLFYNERRMGLWNGQTCTDFEYAFKNSISVYNNRKIMDLLLSRPLVERVGCCIYHTVLDLDPIVGVDKVERLCKSSRQLSERNYSDDAISLLKQVDYDHQNRYIVYREMARAYYWKGQYEKAVMYINQAVQFNPEYDKNPWFIREKSWYLYSNKEYVACIQYLLSIKAIVDYAILSMACEKVGDSRACNYAGKCFEVNPDDLLLTHGYPSEEVIWRNLFQILINHDMDVQSYCIKYEQYLKSKGMESYPYWYGELFNNKKEHIEDFYQSKLFITKNYEELLGKPGWTGNGGKIVSSVEAAVKANSVTVMDCVNYFEGGADNIYLLDDNGTYTNRAAVRGRNSIVPNGRGGWSLKFEQIPSIVFDRPIDQANLRDLMAVGEKAFEGQELRELPIVDSQGRLRAVAKEPITGRQMLTDWQALEKWPKSLPQGKLYVSSLQSPLLKSFWEVWNGRLDMELLSNQNYKEVFNGKAGTLLYENDVFPAINKLSIWELGWRFEPCL